MTPLSWLAVIAGFAGTWIAGRHRTGWLIGASSASLWLIYDVAKDIPAGAFAAAVAIVLSVRNYRIGRRRRVMKPELPDTDGPKFSKKDRKELLLLLLNVRRKEKAVKRNDRETR